MDQHQPTPLLDRLQLAAGLWAAATGRSLGALATIVVNHGSFFERIESGGAGVTTSTLEKFARYLSDAGNWPDGSVPEEVCRFAHVVGVASDACAASPDICAANIGEESRRPPAAAGADRTDVRPSASMPPVGGVSASSSSSEGESPSGRLSSGAAAQSGAGGQPAAAAPIPATPGAAAVGVVS